MMKVKRKGSLWPRVQRKAVAHRAMQVRRPVRTRNPRGGRPVRCSSIGKISGARLRRLRMFPYEKLKVIKVAGRALSLVALALATPVHGEDDFPLVGTYTENQACKTGGS